MPKEIKKVLIIENEYDLDNSIQAFLKDNPGLFESVNQQTFCLNRKVEDLFRFVPEVDTIMIATTFMYKDQVISYCKKFLSLPNETEYKFNFFVFRCCRTFNEWKSKTESWQEEKELRELIIELLARGHKIYDYHEDHDKPSDIDDGLNYPIQFRSPYTYHELSYSYEHDVFYSKSDQYLTLNKMSDEYKG